MQWDVPTDRGKTEFKGDPKSSLLTKPMRFGKNKVQYANNTSCFNNVNDPVLPNLPMIIPPI